MAKQKQLDITWHPAFLTAYAKTCKLLPSCDAAGISPPTYYTHMERIPEFAAAVRIIKTTAIDQLEEHAFSRAYVSDRVLLALLKAHRPEVYDREKRVSHAVGGSVGFEVTFKPPEQMRQHTIDALPIGPAVGLLVGEGEEEKIEEEKKEAGEDEHPQQH